MNKNQWFFTDLSNVSRKIYEIGRATAAQAYSGKGKNRFQDTPALVKTFYLTFELGERIGENLQTPRPRVVSVFPFKGINIVKIERVNEKNFEHYKVGAPNKIGRPTFKGVGNREVITVNIPIDEEYDNKIWSYIFDNGSSMNLDFLKVFGGYENRARLSQLIERNFRANLTDGEKIYKNAGITPHILRHMRDYNLRVNKGYPPESVQKIIGWHNEKMMHYYLMINKTLKDEEQLQFLEPRFLRMKQENIPKFRIGEGLADLSS
jgi:hypothetical protein